MSPIAWPRIAIARAGDFRQWRKEEQICGGSERWKDKRAALDESEQCEQSNGDKAIYANINSPYQTCRKVVQQPFQSQVGEQDSNVLELGMLLLFGPSLSLLLLSVLGPLGSV